MNDIDTNNRDTNSRNTNNRDTNNNINENSEKNKNSKYIIVFDDKLTKQIAKLRQNQKLYSKFLTILQDIELDPYSLTFKAEILKHNYSGYRSKRLDQKNRIIYKIIEQQITVVIVNVLGHYDER
jgi:toxin YoeB